MRKSRYEIRNSQYTMPVVRDNFRPWTAIHRNTRAMANRAVFHPFASAMEDLIDQESFRIKQTLFPQTAYLHEPYEAWYIDLDEENIEFDDIYIGNVPIEDDLLIVYSEDDFVADNYE